jgi:hypothetical protein
MFKKIPKYLAKLYKVNTREGVVDYEQTGGTAT